jgi:hypothetical protein
VAAAVLPPWAERAEGAKGEEGQLCSYTPKRDMLSPTISMRER